MRIKKLNSALVSTFLVLSSFTWSTAVHAEDATGEFDRLDGVGKSGKKVEVIEWEGNLEIHVYPKGSLKGLSLKLDAVSKDKKVMVIGYRFDNTPTPMIRRNILGIPIADNFKTYRDPREQDFDKIIISNNGLSDQVAEYKLDPPPAQMYPAGHPALGQSEERKPAAQAPAQAGKSTAGQPPVDEDGDPTIKSFNF